MIVILLWFLAAEVVNAALAGKLVQKEDILASQIIPPASSLDDNVCIDSCRKYFSNDAWEVIQARADEMEVNPVWYCGRCHTAIDDEEQSSIVCECCLCWFHFNCANLKNCPKSKSWFCRDCTSSSL